MASGQKRDYYEVLGIGHSSNLDDIKRAYRKLALQHHPDHNPDDAQAEESFKEASEAYAVLSDPEKRQRYDRFGPASFANGAPGFDRVDLGTLQQMLGGLVGEIFGRGAGGGREPRDLNYDLEITLEEAAASAEKTVEYERNEPCPRCGASRAEPGSRVEPCSTCQGKGQAPIRIGFFTAYRTCSACEGKGTRILTPCYECHGSGQVKRRERLNVRIPAGIETGAVRTVRGFGEQTREGAGNLHVNVRIKQHPLFERQGADILCRVPVSFPQAALSAELEVPTLEGKVKMKLPAGTQSGHVFRLRGKGMPVFGGYGKGDQLVTILVEVPSQLNERQRHLLEQLASEMSADTLPEQKSFMEKLKILFG